MWKRNLFIPAFKVNSYKNILSYYSFNPVTMKDNYGRIVTKANSQSNSQSLVFFHFINYLRFNLSPKSDSSVCISRICLIKAINVIFWGKVKRLRKPKDTGNKPVTDNAQLLIQCSVINPHLSSLPRKGNSNNTHLHIPMKAWCSGQKEKTRTQDSHAQNCF